MSEDFESRRAVTIGQMMRLSMLPPGPPGQDRLTLIWKPPSEGFPAGSPGLARLKRIALNEWGTELDPHRFSLLRDHLHWFLRDRDGNHVGSFGVDALTLDQAAEVLEHVIGDPPTRRLLDDACSACVKCGGPLDEEERAQRRGCCAGCRSHIGKVIELDIAIKTGVGDRYDQAGNDPLEIRYPEWRDISTFICERYNILRVNRDAWDRFRRWFMTNYCKNRGEFLQLMRSELLDLLRDGVPTAIEPVQVSTTNRQPAPPSSGSEAPAAFEPAPHDPAPAVTLVQVALKEPSPQAVQCYRLKFITGAEKTQAGIALAVYGDRGKQYQVSRDLEAVAAWIKAGNVLPDLDETKPRTNRVDPSKIDLGSREDRGRVRKK